MIPSILSFYWIVSEEKLPPVSVCMFSFKGLLYFYKNSNNVDPSLFLDSPISSHNHVGNHSPTEFIFIRSKKTNIPAPKFQFTQLKINCIYASCILLNSTFCNTIKRCTGACARWLETCKRRS